MLQYMFTKAEPRPEQVTQQTPRNTFQGRATGPMAVDQSPLVKVADSKTLPAQSIDSPRWHDACTVVYTKPAQVWIKIICL